MPERYPRKEAIIGSRSMDEEESEVREESGRIAPGLG
jgi:hypothetical protein